MLPKLEDDDETECGVEEYPAHYFEQPRMIRDGHDAADMLGLACLIIVFVLAFIGLATVVRWFV